MTPYSNLIKDRAISLRVSGNSLNDIANDLKISKSTASRWLRTISLSKTALGKIDTRRESARKLALQTIRNKSRLISEQIKYNASNLCKILCSFLYWGEGGKVDNYVSFINSDPEMIHTFLKLFRKSFSVQEQNIKKYWSQISQFLNPNFPKAI